jgi:hypothetical protein
VPLDERTILLGRGLINVAGHVRNQSDCRTMLALPCWYIFGADLIDLADCTRLGLKPYLDYLKLIFPPLDRGPEPDNVLRGRLRGFSKAISENLFGNGNRLAHFSVPDSFVHRIHANPGHCN